jgi:hypothetical protein
MSFLLLDERQGILDLGKFLLAAFAHLFKFNKVLSFDFNPALPCFLTVDCLQSQVLNA